MIIAQDSSVFLSPGFMKTRISRRGFVRTSLLASTVLPLRLGAQDTSGPQPTTPGGTSALPEGPLPVGRIGNQEFSRMFIGGNLIGGWSHSRDLHYVSTLMRRYN